MERGFSKTQCAIHAHYLIRARDSTRIPVTQHFASRLKRFFDHDARAHQDRSQPLRGRESAQSRAVGQKIVNQKDPVLRPEISLETIMT
jgi:N-acetyl-anhydromuramyl-L-alanine amidase AmpD